MTIRPLVWTQSTTGPDEYLTVADAAPCAFRYEIDRFGNDARPWRIKRTRDIQCFGFATSLDAAKARAQQDFVDLIQSAFITPSERTT